MAERKPLFMDTVAGYPKEMDPGTDVAAGDSITLGGLTMLAAGNDIVMAGKRITGLLGSSGSGEAIADSQAGATLGGLSIQTNPITMGTQKITGLGAATADNDALAYGQSGANLSGLDIDTSALTMNSQKVTGLGSASADGDALAYGQSNANLAGLTIDTAPLAMSSQKITGMAAGDAATDAVNKSQLDAAITGLTWKDPVSVPGMVSDADQSGAPPVGPAAGEAYVVNNWGGGYTDGDIVEYSGSAWVVIVDEAAAGEPPDGTRVLVTGGTAAGSFAGEEQAMATYDATGNSWSFVAPSEGDALLVVGEGSLFENNGYTFDNTTWVQFTGVGQIIAGDGLTKVGNTMSVDLEAAGSGTGGLAFNAGELRVDLAEGLELTANGLGANPDGASGLTVDGGGLKVKLAAAGVDVGGLVFDGSGDLQVKTDGAHGVILTATGVEAEVNTSAGMEVGASGLAVNLVAAAAGDGGLEFDGTDGVQVKVLADGSQAIELTSTGVAVKIGNGDQLIMDTDGLKVAGVPAPFNIGATAVSANVTAPNLTELTGGGATTLHTHTGLAASEAPLVRSVAFTTDDILAVGDPVYTKANGNIGKAQAGTDALALAVGISDAVSSAAATGPFVALGVLTGLSGLTAGTAYYLGDSGGLDTFTNISAGNRVIRMGYALTTTTLWVKIDDFGQKAA